MARRVRLQIDGNGNPVQGALHPRSTVSFSYGATAGKNADPLEGQVVRLRATSDCYVRFSQTGENATSSDMYLEANKPEIFSLREDKYVSAIRVTTDGTMYVTIMD